MRHDTQVALIDRILDHMAAGTTDRGPLATSPVARYLDAARLAREQAMIRTMPTMVCASSLVAQPGSWFAHDLSGTPIVVVRGDDGVLRGFVNACRHRGARLVDDEHGTGRRAIVCRYHAWTYTLQGALRGLPHPEEFPGLDRTRHALRDVPVTEAGGLVWAIVDAGATRDVAGALAPMLDDLRSFGFERYVAFDRRRFEKRHDWKLAADANLEAYHFGHLHRDTIAPLFQDDRMVADAFGDHWRIVLPKRSIEALRTLPRAQWRIGDHCNVIYWCFPNTMFLYIGDDATVFSVWPAGVGRSVIDAITLVPEAPATEKARAHWQRNVEIFWDALLEDFALMESMQSTFASGANEHLTFGASEFCAAAFHASVERHLARIAGGAGVTVCNTAGAL